MRVEVAAVVGRAASRSRAAGRPRSRPGNVVQPVPIAAEGVGVAVADAGQPVLGRRSGRRGGATACRGVVGLNASSASGWTAGSGSSSRRADPALGAQRVGHERMGRDREAALRRGRRAIVVRSDSVRPDRPLDEQREQVAAAGRDLLADDDLEPQAAVAGHRPGGDGRIDPLVVGDRDDVEVGLPLDVVEDGLDAGGPVGGEGVDVQVGAPRRSAWSVMRGARRSGSPVARRPRRRVGGWPSGRRRRLEVRPDREEDRPPLLGRVRDEPLEGARPGRAIVAVTRSRRVPSAGTSTGEDPAAVLADRLARTHGQRIGRHAALDGQHRRAHRQRRRGAEERDRRPAAGQVAVADEPDRDAVAQRLRAARGAPRAGRRAGCRPRRGSARTRPAARVVERLHRRRRSAPTRNGEEQAGELDRPEVEADEEDRLARARPPRR